MRRFLFLVSFTVVCCIFTKPSTPAVGGETTEMPVLVNVLPGVTITDDEIAAMIKEANKILKQADTKLKFNKGTDIKRNFRYPDDGNDGNIDSDEDDELDPKAVEELEKHTGKAGQGTKIVIGNQIHGSNGTLGLAAHNPKSPVIYIKKGQTAKKGGNTIAHEFGHVYTLGKNHVVDDKGTSDPSDDEKADDKGHTTSSGNLMHGTADGENLTPEQIKELKKGMEGHGKTSGSWFGRAWRWIKRQFSSTNSYVGLGGGGMMLNRDGFTLSTDISFTGGMGLGETATLAMHLNTDDDPFTGQNVTAPGGLLMEGIDRTLEITIEGDPEAGGFVQGRLLDETGLEMRPVDVDLEHILKLEEEELIDPYSPYDQVRVQLDLAELGIVQPTAVFVTSENNDESEYDSAEFLLDPMAPEDPEPVLNMPVVEAMPGDFIDLSGDLFFPDSDILLQLDDEEMGIFPADPGGQFFGGFQLPLDLAPGMYYVTASTRDPLVDPLLDIPETQFDFKMLKVVPEPSSLIMLGIAVLSLCVGGWRKRR